MAKTYEYGRQKVSINDISGLYKDYSFMVVVHGVLHGIDDYVVSSMLGMGGISMTRKNKINYNGGNPYFIKNNRKIYLNDVVKVGTPWLSMDDVVSLIDRLGA